MKDLCAKKGRFVCEDTTKNGKSSHKKKKIKRRSGSEKGKDRRIDLDRSRKSGVKFKGKNWVQETLTDVGFV